MTPPIFLPLPGNGKFAVGLAGLLGGEVGRMETRRFPDGETYLRLLSEVAGRDIVLVCTLDRPDTKLVPLLIAADAARELGALSVGLVAPYRTGCGTDRACARGRGAAVGDHVHPGGGGADRRPQPASPVARRATDERSIQSAMISCGASDRLEQCTRDQRLCNDMLESNAPRFTFQRVVMIGRDHDRATAPALRA